MKDRQYYESGLKKIEDALPLVRNIKHRKSLVKLADFCRRRIRQITISEIVRMN